VFLQTDCTLGFLSANSIRNTTYSVTTLSLNRKAFLSMEEEVYDKDNKEGEEEVISLAHL
jgi:hypothetical protein